MNRAILAACGTATGLYCGTAAFRMGLNTAGTWEGYIFGVAFVSVVIGSWFLLPRAAQAKRVKDWATMWALRAGYALAFMVIVLNAVGFTALHRTTSVAAKTTAIDTYETARKENLQLVSDLQTAKQSTTWLETAGCTEPRTRPQKTYCARADKLDSRIQANRATVTEGRPGEADPLAATVAWVTGIDERAVGRADPIIKALALEILTTIFWLGAMAGGLTPVRAKASRAHVAVSEGWAATKTGRSLSPRDRGVITRQIKKLQQRSESAAEAERKGLAAQVKRLQKQLQS